MEPEAIGGQGVGSRQHKARPTAGYQLDHASGKNAANNLGNDVGQEVRALEAAPSPQAKAHGRVDVAARDRANGIDHREQGEAKGKGDP